MESQAYIIAWEFLIKAESAGPFQQIYGPDGDWARLFHRDTGYIKTVLLQDNVNPERFVVLDYWESQEAYARFKETHQTDYDALDRRCEALTETERPLGTFIESL